MDGSVTVITNPTVTVRVTSTVSSFEVNRRFNRGITIAEFKVRQCRSCLLCDSYHVTSIIAKKSDMEYVRYCLLQNWVCAALFLKNDPWYFGICYAIYFPVKELGITLVWDSVLFKIFKTGLVFFFFQAMDVIFWSYADVVHVVNMVKSQALSFLHDIY